MTKITKISYHNDIYQTKFIEKLKENEMNILFAIFSQLKNNSEIVTISWHTIKQIINLPNMKNRELIKYLDKLADLFTSIKLKKATDKEDQTHVLFISCDNKKDSELFFIYTNPNLKGLFNSLDSGNFTVLNFAEFLTLTGKYSKLLYYTLSQHRNKAENKRKLIYPIEEFRDMLGIPKTYQMCDINKRIIEPSVNELEKFFPNIVIEKIKQGPKVVSLQITWKNKIKSKLIKDNSENVSQIESLQEINNSIPVKTKGTEKAKKVINSTLEDKKNAVTKEQVDSMILTDEEIRVGESNYLRNGNSKADLEALRKKPFIYKMTIKLLVKQEEQNND